MPVESPSQAPKPEAASKSSYGQILTSTALIGGASALNLLIGIARGKTTALILGPEGVGLNGLYQSISSVAEGVAGLGINSSGVRQIAEAYGSGDEKRLAVTTAAVRRTSLALGLAGALVLAAVSVQVSQATFGDAGQTTAVCILALGLLFKLVNVGQGALLQGMRRIGDVAKVGVLGALFGAVLTIALVYFLRQSGVAMALAGSSGVALALSWWFSRRLQPAYPGIPAAEVWSEAKELLHLGAAFMASNLLMVGSGYAVRALVLDAAGLEATGLYQAAWTVGSMYTSFILQAMGSDFYPRLTAAGNNHAECNRLVNEQARVSLLLAGAGIVAMLTFSPWIVQLFYSAKFTPAVETLRWISLGTAMQVISWPMGFVLVARNAKTLFLASDTAWTVVHIGLAWLGMRSFGLAGAGMAFFAAYVFHAVFNYVLVSRLTGFRWTGENLRAGAIYLASIGSAFAAFSLVPFGWAMAVGGLIAVLSGLSSVRALVTLVPPETIPGQVRRLLQRTGLMPAGAA